MDFASPSGNNLWSALRRRGTRPDINCVWKEVLFRWLITILQVGRAGVVAVFVYQVSSIPPVSQPCGLKNSRCEPTSQHQRQRPSQTTAMWDGRPGKVSLVWLWCVRVYTPRWFGTLGVQGRQTLSDLELFFIKLVPTLSCEFDRLNG